MEKFSGFVVSVSDHLLDGQNTAIHCRAGIGRAGILASCCLIYLGMDPEQAISTVSAGRGVSIPDTKEQADFIRSYPSFGSRQKTS